VPALPLVALFGPTGVGKTAVALALARELRARGEDPVAISADALQVYQGLEVLTGAADAAERAELEHRLVGITHVSQTFSAGRFAQLAHEEIDRAVRHDRRPIVVGGTGLYLRAALADLDLRPPPDPEIRARWTKQLEQRGPAALHTALKERAPQAAAEIAPTDSVRLIRALELLEAGEAPPQREGPSQLWTTETRHPTVLAGLVMDRDALYERIERRVDAMLEAGVEEEVRRADAAGASPTARKALGFEALLTGDVETMKRDTRRYARRQLTWMRKLPDVHLLDMTARSPEDAVQDLIRWM
jgi:tRNA dimethylallyltransferase